MNQSCRQKDMKPYFDNNRDPNFSKSPDVLLGLLNSLSLPDHYKTDHLLDTLGDLPPTDLPTIVEPVSLNAVNVQTTFIPSAVILLWYPDDDDPGPVYQNRECHVKRI